MNNAAVGASALAMMLVSLPTTRLSATAELFGWLKLTVSSAQSRTTAS